MGWFGYGIYDGDGTFTTQLALLKKSGIDENYINDVYCEQLEIELLPEHKKAVIKSYPKLIKYLNPKTPKKLMYEDWPVSWQMFADLIINNNLPLTKQIKNCALIANEWLRSEHALDFDRPKERVYELKQFEQKLNKYYIKTHKIKDKK